MIQPKGAKVLVKVLEKQNFDDTTDSGIIITAKDQDSHDRALLKGIVEEIGTTEYDRNGILRSPDILIGTTILFNRYNAFRCLVKGTTEYYLVDTLDIWGTETND